MTTYWTTWRCPYCLHRMLKCKCGNYNFHLGNNILCCACLRESSDFKWLTWAICPTCRYILTTTCSCLVENTIRCCSCQNINHKNDWLKFLPHEPDNIDLLSL